MGLYEILCNDCGHLAYFLGEVSVLPCDGNVPVEVSQVWEYHSCKNITCRGRGSIIRAIPKGVNDEY